MKTEANKYRIKRILFALIGAYFFQTIYEIPGIKNKLTSEENTENK